MAGFDLSVLLDDFRDEARAQLDALDAALLKVEESGSLGAKQRNTLLRGLHTLKGNAGMLGLASIRDFVHALESAFKESRAWSQDRVDTLFEAAAALRRAIERAGSDGQEAAFRRLDTLAPALEDGPVEEAEEATLDPTPEPEVGGATEVLRVPFRKLDALLNEVGELIGAEAGLEDMLRRNRAALEAAGLRKPLEERLRQVNRAAESLRSMTLDLRLVPVGRVFSRFPGLARDLARREDKRVRVVLRGEDTELDKSTVDVLGDVMLHLVRNAVDHGIEAPEAREAAGKPPEGTIVLRAGQEGDQVRIEVEDDGRGLDRSAIVARARELGIVAEDVEPENPGALIFTPGFSTRSEADEVSGRGVGLDAVRDAVARLRGTLEIDAMEVGTRFVLRLPLTVAIVPALIFESDGEVLALPALDVEETTRHEGGQRIGPTEVVRRRGELVPLARPSRVLGWVDGKERPDPARFLMFLRQGARRAAVTADRLLDQRDVVVKGLPGYLGEPRGVSGATVTPDGRVVLLLDANDLIDLNLEMHRRGSRAG